MNDSIDIKICEMVLSDALTFYLTFCGILISVLTLLYSFIMSKRSELELYAELSKKGNNDPLLNKRFQLAVNYKEAEVNCFVDIHNIVYFHFYMHN